MPSPKLIPLLLALIGLTLLIFGIWPGIDLAVTAHYHDARGFPVRSNASIETLRNLLWDASLLIPLLALILLALAGWLRRPVLALSARAWGFVLLLFLLGPGVLVNGILKAQWGRARPVNVVDFGGTAQFTPAYQISDQCAANCSFVSGEGAGSMAMTITALLILWLLRDRLPRALYRLGQAAALLMLAFVGWQRVASGGHFLSDVLLSWLFVALIAAILARFTLPAAPPRR
jgi:lipid A 4'-phosphatase